MRGYKAFPIAPFTKGMDKAQEPWLTPEEAFTDLENCYIDRGILKERGGVSKFGQLGVFEPEEQGFNPEGGNQYTVTLTNPTPILRSVKVYDSGGPQVLYDDGNGVLSGDGTGTIEYTGVDAGDIDVTFTGAIIGTTTVDYHYSETGTDRTVRGVHLWNKDNGDFELLAMDKRRLSTWDTTLEYFKNVPSGTAVVDEAWDTGAGGGATKTYTKSGNPPANIPLVPFTVKISEAVTEQTLYDNGYGVFIDSVGGIGTGTINYTTGVISVTFETAIGAGDPIVISYHHAATVVYDIWNNSNLVWAIDWQDLVWMCDDSSNIYIYNGTYAIDITPRLVYDADGHIITSARTMEIFEERLLLFNTIEDGDRYSQRVRCPAQGNSLTVDAWRDDVAGQGDFNDATADQEIVTTIPFKGRIVVFLEETAAFIVYTSDPVLPFGWKMLNNKFETNSTFGFWDFEDFVVSTGKIQLNAFDGTSVQKANKLLPKFTNEIDYDNINQCFGHLVPSKKQAWLAYPSGEVSDSLIYPNRILVFNYENGTTSEYEFLDSDRVKLATYCFENYFYQSDVTYTDLENAEYWSQITAPAVYENYENFAYGQVSSQGDDELILAGSEDGYIYNVDDRHSVYDSTEAYNFNIVTKRFNPFMETGRGVSLGHIDFLVSAIADCEVEVRFYLGFTDNDEERLRQTFLCDGSGDKVIKRVYCNAEANVIGYSLAHKPLGSSRAKSFELHSHTPYFKSGSKVI